MSLPDAIEGALARHVAELVREMRGEDLRAVAELVERLKERSSPGACTSGKGDFPAGSLARPSDFLRAEEGELTTLLNAIPEADVLGRRSIAARLEEVRRELYCDGCKRGLRLEGGSHWEGKFEILKCGGGR